MLKAGVRSAGGDLIEDLFLVDTGADRTVFSAGFLKRTGLSVHLPTDGMGLSGIGGVGAYVVLDTTLELISTDGTTVYLRGTFAVFTDPKATDSGLLGRDVLDLFDVIVSRKRDAVLLLAGNHSYKIE